MDNIIFLDIDGVLNSFRTCKAYKGYPWPDEPATWWKLDDVAIGLLRRVVKECNAKIVLSSTWRHFVDLKRLENKLEVPIQGITFEGHMSIRGEEVAHYLKQHIDTIRSFVIIDDDSDFTDSQKERLVLVSHRDGMLVDHMLQMSDILGRELSFEERWEYEN